MRIDAHVGMCIHVCVCGCQRLTSGCPPQWPSTLLFLRQGLCTEPEACRLAEAGWPAHRRALPASASLCWCYRCAAPCLECWRLEIRCSCLLSSQAPFSLSHPSSPTFSSSIDTSYTPETDLRAPICFSQVKSPKGRTIVVFLFHSVSFSSVSFFLL